jgi:hypothetical protein
MSNPPPPNPVSKQALSRASTIGGILGAVGIVLFVVLWVVLGQAGVQTYTRLFLSLCVPPAGIALLMGLYALRMRSRLKK